MEPLYVLVLNINEESHASSDIPIRIFPFLVCVLYTYKIQMSRWQRKRKLEGSIHHEVDALPDGSCNQAQSPGRLPNHHHLSRPDVFYFKACAQGPKKHLTFPPKHDVKESPRGTISTFFTLETSCYWSYCKSEVNYFEHVFVLLMKNNDKT